jgi:hypothetical protein
MHGQVTYISDEGNEITFQFHDHGLGMVITIVSKVTVAERTNINRAVRELRQTLRGE